ncbi:hypothetical protein QW71_17315 [Paenibacillus sp. IHB B 3415]|uniref:hypothetical protein n=1 Tax=Paenibacillus sp. IHB B 3415 TaxID=867080 RepID=UPI0005737B25|nr:hypothetical protein [Paenibacillus sp. IHB B 3415]KHL94559.1 hypothetical protein QW71_17315 [Paenibacillus sp. IHB B 3415]
MLELNTSENLELILGEYLAYLNDGTSVKEIVKERYYRDVEVYFYNVLFKKVGMVKGFGSFFSTDYINELFEIRIGGTVYPAITHLLTFMRKTNRLDEEQYLKINKSLEEIRPAKKKKNDIKFIDQNQVDFMFSDKIQYNFVNGHKIDYSIYEYASPLIWSLAYDCGFEQKHILNFLISDIDLINYRIRNLRRDKHLIGHEWIDLGARTFNYLQKYLQTRSSSNLKHLILIDGEPLETSDINKTFDIIIRKENSNGSFRKANIEILVRSGLLKSLKETNGQSLLKQILIHGVDSKGQLDHAMKQYFSSTSEIIQ